MNRPVPPSICDNPYDLALHDGGHVCAINTTPELLLRMIPKESEKGYLKRIVRNSWNSEAETYNSTIIN